MVAAIELWARPILDSCTIIEEEISVSKSAEADPRLSGVDSDMVCWNEKFLNQIRE